MNCAAYNLPTYICNVHHVYDALNMITIFIVWAAWQGDFWLTRIVCYQDIGILPKYVNINQLDCWRAYAASWLVGQSLEFLASSLFADGECGRDRRTQKIDTIFVSDILICQVF
jgi:hypothetical protein